MVKLYKFDIEKVAGGMIEPAGETKIKNVTRYQYDILDNDTCEVVLECVSKKKEEAEKLANKLDEKYHNRKKLYGMDFAKKVVKIDENYDEWVDRYYIETHDDISIENNYTL